MTTTYDLTPNSPSVPQPDFPSSTPDLLTWSEQHRYFAGQPMRVPGPLRELYQLPPDVAKVVVMKGAQIGASEWAINLALWCADTGYAGRGASLYVQPSGDTVGDFVQARVNPVFDQSQYLLSRIRPTGNSKDPDKVGLRKVGPGYTYWRTSRSRAALKSAPIDVLILDEYDEMDSGVLALASHRLDSSTAPLTVIVSTPRYPMEGVEPQYLAGDQRRFMLTCECGTEQALDWEKNVTPEGRACVECRESLESVILAAWEGAGGRWVPQRESSYRSYHLSQLYHPHADLGLIRDALESSNASVQQEAWNQHLGLPYSPPGGQLSAAELRRLSEGTPFTVAEIAGVQGCMMGVDVGARLHVTLTWDDVQGNFGSAQRYVVGAYEVDGFDDIPPLMQRFGVRCVAIDAHPELHAAQAFAFKHPGRVFLVNYVNGQTSVQFTTREPDPKRSWRINVDRTFALDTLMGALRGERIRFPRDIETVPGFFAHLQAPVRKMRPGPDGNSRAVYDEGSHPDHYAHSLLYSELASFVGPRASSPQVFDTREMSPLGSYERRGRL